MCCQYEICLTIDLDGDLGGVRKILITHNLIWMFHGNPQMLGDTCKL